MNIWLVVIAIGLISILLSLISFKNLNDKSVLRQAKKKLLRGRVVFQDSSVSNK